MIIHLKNKHTLKVDDFTFKCSVGKNGLSKKKVEGDKKTPKGKFSIGPLYYRQDRISKPQTKIKTIAIKKNMIWCDDSKSNFYNKLSFKHNKIKGEKMFRQDFKYNLVLVINYNTKKPKKNKGSAIFLHLTKNYKKTLGCIVLKKNDFLILLKIIDKKTKIIIS